MVDALVEGIKVPVRLIRYCRDKNRLMALIRTTLIIGLYFIWVDESNATVCADECDANSDLIHSEMIRNYGLLVAAFGAGALAFWRSIINQQQANITKQGHITERFSKASEMLGSKELPVRQGGIYALWGLADEYPGRYQEVVWNLLRAFVRNPPHNTELNLIDHVRPDQVRPDNQAILDLLVTKETVQLRDTVGYQLNLSNSNLSGVNLSGANLRGADLSGANLSGADLSRANLIVLDLSGLDLSEANLKRANLDSANLSRVNLQGADLSGANLNGADLNRANLFAANLSGLDLSWADLSRANLIGANLSGATLSGADLSGANLGDARNLTQQQLDEACQNPDADAPRLPDGLEWHGRICERYKE